MAFYVVLIVIFTFLPNVSRAIFSVWVCVWYEDVPGAAQAPESAVVLPRRPLPLHLPTVVME